MVTKQQALSLGYGSEVHYTGRHDCTRKVGPRGGVTESVTRCRVTGSCKTWKTRPNDFRLPVKYGMREYAAIDHDDAGNWHLAAECPLAKERWMPTGDVPDMGPKCVPCTTAGHLYCDCHAYCGDSCKIEVQS